jgi:hypothetical protein
MILAVVRTHRIEHVDVVTVVRTGCRPEVRGRARPQVLHEVQKRIFGLKRRHGCCG